ncbi:MAG: lmo0937 family membrane protein [Bacilli bacterium]
MAFLRWLGGIVLFFWVVGLIFNFFGAFIHILLIVAAIIFLVDWITGKGRK